ncbi:MAG TPA: hypothetical protein VHF69_11770, partial [Candidatus Synoicihabitans sp.]|nr:hypothetical protein [Candidatus Synoicihabitans sp.]
EGAVGLRLRRGSLLIRPESAWLEEFSSSERARWLLFLGMHRNNVTYRWPLTVADAVLDGLAARDDCAEAVRRVRRWGNVVGSHVVFGDLWALEDAFTNVDVRRDFLRAAVRSDTPFLKLQQPPSEAQAASDAAYWHVNGRYRAIEPFYNAVRRVEGHARIDLAHFLPRFARSLLYTFPPDFAAARDLAVESGLVAADFFTSTPDASAVADEDFSTWLARECESVETATQFGDIVIFEDPARTRWPYAAVYLADGMLFARRPTLFGPWTFMTAEEIKQANPRLRGSVRVYRRKTSLVGPGAPVYHPGGVPPAWRAPTPLRTGTRGPWGRLATYDVLLAPPGDMLEGLPEASHRPEWTLYLAEPEALLDDLEALDLPSETRRELRRLLGAIPPGDGRTVTLRPSRELVLNLPGAARARLFRHLVTGARVEDYAQTIKIASRTSADAWFTENMLPPSVRENVLRLTYPQGNAFAISDYGMLFDLLPKDRESRLTAMRTIFRTPALVVLLEKPRPEEVPAVAAYWNLDQQKDVAALLAAFAANDEIHYLDILHLLPPRPREFLNLYTLADATAPSASCYWTALNFDVEQPDLRLLIPPARRGAEAAVAWTKLKDEYIEIDAPGRLGDVVAYREKTGRRELVHVSAFIAEDVVFTKNGFGLMAPWCLMRLADVDALY